LLRYVTALYGPRKHLRDTGSPGPEVNESLLYFVSLLPLGSHGQVLSTYLSNLIFRISGFEMQDSSNFRFSYSIPLRISSGFFRSTP